MDLFATHLVQLRDAHIPILFRPYHEMNGGWFWWGKHAGENGYKKLWIQLYDYYTKEYNLNNLIWVWSPDKPKFGLDEYYPGDNYVDIVGCDIYPTLDTTVVFRKDWYEQISAVADNKLLTLGECGRMPTVETFTEQPRWLWFMTWCDLVYKANSRDELKTLYNSDRVITLDELPKFK